MSNWKLKSLSIYNFSSRIERDDNGTVEFTNGKDALSRNA